MKNLVLILLFATTLCGAQNLDQIRAKYQARKPHLDSMSQFPSRPYQDLIVMTQDSIKIHAWHIKNPEADQTLILVHGFNMNKSHMLSRAEFLYTQGYSIVLMDLRARGLSGGTRATTGAANGLDVLAVYKALEDRGEIHLYGFSHGARAVSFGAALIGNPKQRLFLEGIPYQLAEGFKRQNGYAMPMIPQETELDKALEQNKANQTLLLIGDSDPAITPEEARKLIKYSEHPDSLLMVFPEQGHHVLSKNNTYLNEISPYLISK
ncbi:MAG: alpha/beta hydrolase [Flavobacteriaceae bacterium]